MSKWKTYTIGELADNKIISPPMDGNHGETHPKGDDFLSDGIPFIMASDINNGLIDLEECKFISFKQAQGLRKGFAQEGDVLLTHKATIGRTSIVPDIPYPYLMLTPQVTYYRVLNSSILNNQFLKYYFDYEPFQQTFKLWAGAGSTRAYLGIIGQRNLTIKIPDIKSQIDIVGVLSVIDKKIDINNKSKALLEDIAQTLYNYWLVQFDFPDIEGKPYKSYGGKMVYNEVLKREIPEGWKDSTLWDIAKYYNGLAMQKYRSTDDEYLPVIKIREMNNGISPDTEKARVDIPKAAVIEDGDLLFSWSATLDVKIWSQGKGALNQHIFKVTSDDYPQSFYYFELMNYLSHFKMMADLRKTTMGHITLDHLKQANIVLPPSDLIKNLDEKLKPVFDRSLILQKENYKLIELRDWLLPMLMNGQVTVK